MVDAYETSDDEAVSKRSRKRRQRSRKVNKQKSDDETEHVDTTLCDDDEIAKKVSERENESDNEGDKADNNVEEDEDTEIGNATDRRKSARNYWLKLQLEMNDGSFHDKEQSDDDDKVVKTTDSVKTEGNSSGSEVAEEATSSNNARMSAFAKNYWLKPEKKEVNESQDDEEYLDAEDENETEDIAADETTEKGASTNNSEDENVEVEQANGKKIQDTQYRMSATVKNFWLNLERSDELMNKTESEEQQNVEVNENQDDDEGTNQGDENSDVEEVDKSDEVNTDASEPADPAEPADEYQEANEENPESINQIEEQNVDKNDKTDDDKSIKEESDEELHERVDESHKDEYIEKEVSHKESYETNIEQDDDIDLAGNARMRSNFNTDQYEDKPLNDSNEMIEMTSPDDVVMVVDNASQNNEEIQEDPVLRRFISQDAAHTDEESTGDNFNSNYRYVVRHRRSDRFSKRPNDTEPNDTEAANEEVRIRNPRRSAPVTTNEHIESLYNFTFKDALSILKAMLPSARSSVDVDGMMSASQKIYDSKSDEEETEEPAVELTPEEPLQINTRALQKESLTYELETFERNALIIFNQENVDGYKPRTGSRLDVEALTDTFGRYGFEVVEHLDLTRARIFEELKKFSQRNFTDYGCVAVAVLTHGSDMGSLRAKDRRFYETDVVNYFKSGENPTLVTKPKLIIIQACRGSKSTAALNVGRVTSTIRKDNDDMYQPKTYTLPVESDFLVLHSTFVGKTSHRDEVLGSWFIQTLCQKINELAHNQDFEAIITEVKREVAIEKSLEEYNKRTTVFDINKQMPIIVSTLIRKLFFRRFGSIAPFVPEAVTDTIKSPIRLASCACFLDRFEYLRNCMRYFLEDNEDDQTARGFLNVADAIEDGVEFDPVKEQIAKAMSNHLKEKAKNLDYYRFLYFKV